MQRSPNYFCYCRIPISKIEKDQYGHYKICELCGGLIGE